MGLRQRRKGDGREKAKSGENSPDDPEADAHPEKQRRAGDDGGRGQDDRDLQRAAAEFEVLDPPVGEFARLRGGLRPFLNGLNCPPASADPFRSARPSP